MYLFVPILTHVTLHEGISDNAHMQRGQSWAGRVNSTCDSFPVYIKIMSLLVL